MPVWMSHGVRGDFTDYRGKSIVKGRSHWHFSVFATGALPYFERTEEFCDAFGSFLDGLDRPWAGPEPASRRAGAGRPQRESRQGVEGRADVADADRARARAPCPVERAAASAGSTQRRKPSLRASASRSSALPTARTSPARPTSPKQSVCGSTGRPRADEATAASHAEVARRLRQPHAAGDVDEDVLAEHVDAGAPLDHGEQQRHAVGVDAERGAPRHAGRVRDERLDLDEDRPRALDATPHRPSRARRAAARRRNSAEGFCTSPRPSARISKTPISFVEPKRFLVVRRMR